LGFEVYDSGPKSLNIMIMIAMSWVVLTTAEDLKVLWPVVISVAISVVNNLIRLDWASQHLGCD